MDATAKQGSFPAIAPGIDVVLADGDVVLCDSLCRLLQSMGYSVQTAHEAAQLEELIRQHKPRCLVLALELDGLDLLARLRAQGLVAPAIVTSVQGSVPLAVAAMRAGALNFLEKPLLGARLLQTVRTALHR